MARAELRSLAVGVVQDRSGNVRPGVTFAITPVLYAAETGGATLSGASLKSNVDGELPGWVQIGVEHVIVIGDKTITFYGGEVVGGGSLPTGGAEGQVLVKQSGVDGDADWATTAALSNDDPEPLGAAVPGTSPEASRADHVHGGGLTYGSGAPSGGGDGDSWVDVAAVPARLYGPKAGGVWPSAYIEFGSALLDPANVDLTTIAGLVGWWKADAITGLSDGDPVATWDDLSVTALDLTQATAARKPTYKTAIQNGKPVVRFAATDATNGDYLAAASGRTVKHVLVVAKNTAATFAASHYEGLIGGAGTGDPDMLLTGNEGTALFYNSAQTTAYHRDGTPYAEGAMAAPMAAFHVVSISSTGWTDPLTLQVGRDRNAPSGWPSHWNGDVCEVAAFDVVLSAGDQQIVEAYFKAKWGTP